MIKYITAVFFFIGLITNGYSQNSLADYKYVAVPDQYEFVKGKDKYQLNSLTKFLFNKYGFKAYFDYELPDVKRCEVLWADVEGNTGIVYSRTEVVLRDCNGFELYRSQQGKSKDKDYKKAYHAALRQAFESFAVASEDIKVPTVEGSTESVAVVERENPKEEVVDTKHVNRPNVIDTSDGFVYGEFVILPMEGAGGKYSVLYRNENIGTLTPTSQKNTYLVKTSKFGGIAYKNKNSFVIEREVEGLTELVVMKFEKKKN